MKLQFVKLVICETCCEQVKFRAKRPHQYMILATIVDEEGNWVKNEYYHPPSCYDEAGAPYGPVYTMSPQEGVDLGISEPKIKEAI